MNSITQFLKIGDIVRVKSKVQTEITGWHGAIAWVTNEDPARYEISFFAPLVSRPCITLRKVVIVLVHLTKKRQIRLHCNKGGKG